MADIKEHAEQVDQKVQHHARRVAERPWVEKLARFGFAAKGVVYALIGVLAVQTAAGWGGELTDSQGALQTVDQQPFGQVLLGLIAIGLVGYVIWRLIQALLDTENKGNDAKGLFTRIGYVISGITYGALAFAAARLALNLGGSNSSNGSGSQSAIATVLSFPLGRFLVMAAGLIVVGVGVYQIYQGATRRFEQKLNSGEMSTLERQWSRRSGVVGLIAHGIVLGITGAFVVFAGWWQQPEQAQGTSNALQVLAQQPFGVYLLGAVAIGLVAYGAFSLVEARYRRMIFS